MTITELGDRAPEWLQTARTHHADVEMSNGKVVWKSGTWKNGIWNGGTWCGGIWKGGTWKGGIWEDGTWKRGIWKGGNIKTALSTTSPLTIAGLHWPILIGSDHIAIGCQQHAIATWRRFSDAAIAKMHPDALEWWRKHRTVILALADLVKAKGPTATTTPDVPFDDTVWL